MVTFPTPVQIVLPVYPAAVTLEIDLSPVGMVATVDLDILPEGAFLPDPAGFGNNFEDGMITFTNIAINRGDTLIATTRVTSIQSASVDVSLDHTINGGLPEQLTATISSGTAEKFYAEFIFS